MNIFELFAAIAAMIENMTIDVLIHAGEVSRERISGRIAVVIDVFRATSVITTALAHGAVEVIPVFDLDEAVARRDTLSATEVVLGGEREMMKVDGFDYGNSPRIYTNEAVRGKTVILSTTNGTRALENCNCADDVLIASFLNMSAVCDYLASTQQNIVLVCSGRKDRFTAEDGFCAGAIAGLLTRSSEYELTDIAQLMKKSYIQTRHDIRGALSESAHFRDLIAKGFGEDIDYCLRTDIFNIVPRLNVDGSITIMR